MSLVEEYVAGINEAARSLHEDVVPPATLDFVNAAATLIALQTDAPSIKTAVRALTAAMDRLRNAQTGILLAAYQLGEYTAALGFTASQTAGLGSRPVGRRSGTEPCLSPVTAVTVREVEALHERFDAGEAVPSLVAAIGRIALPTPKEFAAVIAYAEGDYMNENRSDIAYGVKSGFLGPEAAGPLTRLLDNFETFINADRQRCGFGEIMKIEVFYGVHDGVMDGDYHSDAVRCMRYVCSFGPPGGTKFALGSVTKQDISMSERNPGLLLDQSIVGSGPDARLLPMPLPVGVVGRFHGDFTIHEAPGPGPRIFLTAEVRHRHGA